MTRGGLVTNGLWIVKDKPVRVDVWNSVEVKNCLDDALKKSFQDTMKFRLSYRLLDIRLAISTVACLFSGFACLYDYMEPFPKSRIVLAMCAVVYMLLTTVLTLYMLFYEKNTVVVGIEDDPTGMDPSVEWHVATTMQRHSDIIRIDITRRDCQDRRHAYVQKSIGHYFDSDGVLCFSTFESDVKHLVNSLNAPKKSD